MTVLERVDAEFPELSGIVRRILNDYPEYDRNVFLMMSFRETPELSQIASSLRYSLREYGLLGIRADDKAYSDDLWQNICGYMWACRYGVAVFEDIDQRDVNPNIALEYGYMTALGKRTLLLKEQRMPRIPTDITGRLWKPFSAFDIDMTVRRQIDLWAVDLGLSRDRRQYLPQTALIPMIRDILLYYVMTTTDGERKAELLTKLQAIDLGGDGEQVFQTLSEFYDGMDFGTKAAIKSDDEAMLTGR